ncbi:MAG: hypothetical protein HC913_21970 [Microscillaceae bacterium]|nr:hypothetical protein [Microscillaceae bacterium]
MGSLFLLFLLASLALPYLLKDRIHKAVQENVAQRLNARVEMDPAKLHLSLWRNFPNLTIAQGDLRVLGKGVFRGDTLFSAKELSLSVNFWSMLFGGELSVKAFYLDQPRILAKKLASGQANWDILLPQKEKKPAQNLAINIRRWQIRDGYIVYDDRQARHLVALEQINHRGRGNLGQPIAELFTQTDIKHYRLVWAGQSYFERQSLALTLDLKAEQPAQKYTFKKMQCRFNDFALGLEGWMQNKKEGLEMDVRFKGRGNGI